MAKKLDLDDIELKARVCLAASADPWETLDASGRMPDYCDAFAIVKTADGEQIADAYDNTRWSDRQCLDHAAHIAANSPPVTLGLVALIRKLDEACRRVAGESDWCPVCEQHPSTGHHRDCALENGAVLP